ncbi:glycosyltransferase family 4 protein [Escherichia coli]
MKVLYIITKADEIGGAQIHIRDLSSRLKEDGHDVVVIVGEHGALVDELIKRGVAYHIVPSLVREINPIKDLRAVIEISKLISILDPDIISLHSSKAGIIGRLAALRKKKPVIFTAHGWAFANGVSKNRQKLYCIIEKIIEPLASKIITVSEQDKQLALELNVSSHEKQVVIHNGMIQSSLPPRFVNRTSNKTVELISVARFSEQKDHRTLFVALSQINNLNWRLTLVGKGPLLEYYKTLARKLNIHERIQFLGERHDVAELMVRSDVFLLISKWEGFPRSILEAMRAGLPVIASNVGGTSEAINDGITGFLVEREDVDGLKHKLCKLLSEPELCFNMGQAGYQSFISNFTFDVMYQKTYYLYESLLKK